MHEDLRKRIIDTLEWMITDMRWRFDQARNTDGLEGGYSPEFTEAIKLLDELKKGESND